MRSHGRRAAWSFFLVATVAISLALPGLARAQAPDEAAAPQAAPDAQAMQPVVNMTGRVDEKHSGFALGGSLVTTGLGLGAIIAGLSDGDDGESASSALALAGLTVVVIGPSFGHFYAGEYGRGLALTGVRAGALTMMAFGTGICFFESIFEPDCDSSTTGSLLITGGLVLGVGSIVYSIYDAPRATHRHNARARARQLLITPAPMVGPDHSTGIGLQLDGQF